jgi:NADPH-dependent glutamate synthase beta subunit-like oxidoreductase
MVKLKIDNRVVAAKEGAVLMEVIRGTGVEVPSMCYLEGEAHFTSCMVCVVKDRKSGKLIPSCSLSAEDGMDIVSGDEEVIAARKTALELLLSEHVGDCEAPCQVTCPAHMDIPLMNRLLARGEFDEALKVVKKDIALPAVLGRICQAPCEGACRRKGIDEAVSICLLKRYAGDADLAQDESWMPPKEDSSGKDVTVIGSGPAGLAAANHLALKGHRVVLIDRNKLAGGSLRKEVPAEELPMEVLDKEIELIRSTGVEFDLGQPVDGKRFQTICEESDAVVVAVGKGETEIAEWGLPMNEKGVNADGTTYQVGETSVFVVGSALKPSRMAIRALGQGKEAAFSVDQYLKTRTVTGEKFRFNSRFGKLVPAEFSEYLKESREGPRLEPENLNIGLTPEQVMVEAARCLHCDCRDLENCLLRNYSDQYAVNQRRFKSEERAICRKVDQHDLVIYEPSKCIKCGICVRLTEKHGEEFGFTFIGRGFDVVVVIPFNVSLGKGLDKVATEVAEACPTGAISPKSSVQSPQKNELR